MTFVFWASLDMDRVARSDGALAVGYGRAIQGRGPLGSLSAKMDAGVITLTDPLVPEFWATVHVDCVKAKVDGADGAESPVLG